MKCNIRINWSGFYLVQVPQSCLLSIWALLMLGQEEISVNSFCIPIKKIPQKVNSALTLCAPQFSFHKQVKSSTAKRNLNSSYGVQPVKEPVDSSLKTRM